MLKSGHRRNHRVQIQRRGSQGKTPSGNVTTGDWNIWVEGQASFMPKFGREVVLGERLVSSLQGTLTMPRFQKLAEVTPAHRVVFTEGPYKGYVCQIRSIVPTGDNREIEFLIESGVDT